MSAIKVLGIESSCDECSAAVVLHDAGSMAVLGQSTYSQTGIHEPYGGVVPEIASRNHLETINHMIAGALSRANLRPEEVDVLAVTNRPGLVGALLVGVSAAKAMAYALGKPLVPVHHLEGHIAGVFLENKTAAAAPYPMLIAVISGGHTNTYVSHGPPELWPLDFLRKSLVGRSRDDAAGEAFDKSGKTLGLAYPAGRLIDAMAREGNAGAFAFPRALPQKDVLDFSFSGLKTAVALTAQKLRESGTLQNHMLDLCASIQEAIVDSLLAKIYLAARTRKCRSLAVVGGVAANSRMRNRLMDEWSRQGFEIPPLFPAPEYCTDNAAMIAAAGGIRFLQGQGLSGRALLELGAMANPEV